MSQLSEQDIDFSVVIPSYNASSTIERALKSVLEQSRTPKEIIIADDCSDDFSKMASIVEHFAKSSSIPVQLIEHHERTNGAAARNRGIDRASAAYIAFLDADDEWETEKLACFAGVIAETKSPALFFSQVTVVRRGQSISIRPEVAPEASQPISEYLFLAGGFMQTSTIVLASEQAKQIRFDERFMRHQDYDLCLRAASLGAQAVFVPKPLTRYHIEGSQYKSKNENLSYCRWWLGEMKGYMSRHGYWGYRLFLLSGRQFVARDYPALLWNALLSCLCLGPVGLWKARKKTRYVIKNIRN